MLRLRWGYFRVFNHLLITTSNNFSVGDSIIAQEIMASGQQAPSAPSTQYDKIGTKYNGIKVLPAAEPEEPSAKKALGDIRGKKCLGMFDSHALKYYLDFTCGAPCKQSSRIR